MFQTGTEIRAFKERHVLGFWLFLSRSEGLRSPINPVVFVTIALLGLRQFPRRIQTGLSLGLFSTIFIFSTVGKDWMIDSISRWMLQAKMIIYVLFPFGLQSLVIMMQTQDRSSTNNDAPHENNCTP